MKIYVNCLLPTQSGNIRLAASEQPNKVQPNCV